LNVTLLPVAARGPEEYEVAFATMAAQHAGGFITMQDAHVFSERSRLAELAAASGLPAVYPYRENVIAGGLMSYGVSVPTMFRRAAVYVDKILKGANPADLPVEQPTKFELVINLKTAKALGLTIPQPLLLRANEVIQ
jgi:putative ABC transport system substrate-binding protein